MARLSTGLNLFVGWITLSLNLGAFANPLAFPTGLYEPLARDLVPRQSGCGTSGQTSCLNTTVQTDLCCFEAPGGQLLLTQFWDVDPSTGPTNSWTIHGLWPDYCTTGYPESCDSSREETAITSILQSYGETTLLSYMQTYWKDNGGDDESFWAHEWNKHGTCMSTLREDCVSSSEQAAIYYFQTVVNLFKSLPTYTWLSNAGITPSSSTTYTKAAILAALKTGYGYTVGLECSSSTLYQVNYYYHLKGSVIDGSWVKFSTSDTGSCPTSGIKYLPKSGSSTPTTTSGGTSPTGVPSSGTISVLVSGTKTGGLLSYGTWSTQTPGTMTSTTSGSGFTLTSSRGSCGIVSGALTCGSGVSASVFTLTTSGSNRLLTYSGSTAFTASSTPSGTTQVTLYTGSASSVDVTLAFA